MKWLIVVPTYNERYNIEALAEAVLKAAAPGTEILVVDDNSPDGTGDIADALHDRLPAVHVLHRTEKSGLGTAYREGFRWGIDKGFDVLCEMDADFSHDPAHLPDFQRLIGSDETDVVVGSRYVAGGGVRNWGLLRRLISRGGSVYARLFLGGGIRDYTGGFNAWKAGVLKDIRFGDLRSEGYCFQIELKYRASRAGWRIREHPIVFTDRRLGGSKMGSRIVLEAVWRVPTLRLGR